MATESVSTQSRAPFYLPIDDVDSAQVLLSQASGVLECMGEGGPQVGDKALANACWAVIGILEQVGAIVSSRKPAAEAEA
jgi:hypothetical protein